MHEVKLMKDLIKKINEVAEQENAKRIVAIYVWLGALCHLTPDHFMEHFCEDVIGTIAEGAQVKIEVSDDRTDPHAMDVILKSVEIAEE
jgi:hydrogenase nickel incorporation protein HypA/HybF